MSRIDVPSIYTCFPPGIKPPERLIELITWIAETADLDSNALTDFEGERLDDYWIDNGSYLSNQFGLFLHQADGTMAGYWFYEGCDVKKAPIVILGSGSGQGEVEVIANSIEEFAARIVEAKTGINDLDGLVYTEEEEDEEDTKYFKEFWGWDIEGWLSDLGNWLETTWGITPEIRQQYFDSNPKQDHPDLSEWFERWVDEQNNIQGQNPIGQKIYKILTRYQPNSEDYIASVSSDPVTQELLRSELTSEGYFPWLSANFDVLIVGTKFEIWERFYSKNPVKEAHLLEPLFREIRIERASHLPEQGLWFSAWVNVYPDGNINICRGHESNPPEFLGEQPTVDDYGEDLLMFPRSPEWVPSWLSEMLQHP